MEHPLEETIRLLDLTDDRLDVLVASNEIEPSVKNALGELASRRQACSHLGNRPGTASWSYRRILVTA